MEPAPNHANNAPESAAEILLAALLNANHTERTAARLAQETGFLEAETEATLQSLTNAGSVVQIAPLDEGDASGYLLPASWERIKQTARRTAAAYHRKNPYKTFMPLKALREPLEKAATLASPDLRRVALRLDKAGDLVWEPKRGVRLPEHGVVLPTGWEKPAREILGVYQSAGFNPPPPHVFEKDYPRDVNTRAIIQILTETNKLVAVGHEILLAAPVLETAKDAARLLAESPEGLSVGGLRNALSASRKIVVPLLEWMDAQKITVRNGDKRVLL